MSSLNTMFDPALRLLGLSIRERPHGAVSNENLATHHPKPHPSHKCLLPLTVIHLVDTWTEVTECLPRLKKAPQGVPICCQDWKKSQQGVPTKIEKITARGAHLLPRLKKATTRGAHCLPTSLLDSGCQDWKNHSCNCFIRWVLILSRKGESN